LMASLSPFTLEAILRLNSSEYDKGLNNALNSGSKLGGALKTAFSVGAAAVGAATTAITAFAGSSVKAGMEFDSSMSQVAATMGYTVEELNTAGSDAENTFQQLSEFAQQMGSTTAFSASQAADALNYMALAGYDADTAMTMLPNVLNLAAAGNIELAAASDMVTDAQSALGLSLDETAELVDKMARASSKSNTSVEQLGSAILTIGGTAKSMAGGTTELAAALGVLADNGIKGAEGGTALRNVLLGIQSGKFEDYFGALGVQAYDAGGNLRDLSDILNDMNTAMEGMTDQEKTELINQVFNRQDLKSINALLATTTGRWDELTVAIENSEGAAQAMAEVQLDNLAGDITLFKSALEGAKIAISDGLTPSLREFVQFGSSAISTLTEAYKEGGIDGAMEAFGTVLSDGLSRVVSRLPEIVKAGTTLLKALLRGISDNIGLITDTAMEIVMSLVEFILDSLPDVIRIGLDIIVALAKGIAESIPELIPAIIDVVLEIIDILTDPQNLSALVEAAIAIMLALTNGLIEAMPRLIEKLPEIIANLVEALIQNAPLLIQATVQIYAAIAKGMIQNIPVLLSAIGEVFAPLIDAVGEWLLSVSDAVDTWFETNIIQPLGEFFEKLFQGIAEFFSTAWQGISEFFETVWQGITGFFSETWQKIEDFFNPLIDFVRPILDALQYLFETIWEAIKIVVSRAMDAISEKITAIWNAITTFLNNEILEPLKQTFERIWGAIKTFVSETTDRIKEKVTSTWEEAKTSVSSVLDSIKDKIKTIWNSIKTFVSDEILDPLKQEFSDGFNTIYDKVKEPLDKVKSTIEDTFNGIKNFINGLIREALSWGADLINNFVSGITSTVDNVAGTISNVADTIRDFIGFSEPDLGPLSNFHTFAPDMMKLFAQGIRDNEHLITDQLEKSFDFGDMLTVSTADIDAGRSGREPAANQRIYTPEEIATAISRALEGTGVYMDGRKIGMLVTEYQTSRARMMGV